jgi:D-tyrosyl-tRNA(Tyr) deacylase
MKAVIQRVRGVNLTADGIPYSSTKAGLLILLGVCPEDTEKEVDFLVRKCANLRIFEDAEDKLNLSVKDIGGSVLSVSQFTLYGDCRKGRRPSFTEAARPEAANALYEQFNAFLREEGVPVETGRFQTHMEVSLVNDGPVTMLLDSRKNF